MIKESYQQPIDQLIVDVIDGSSWRLFRLAWTIEVLMLSLSSVRRGENIIVRVCGLHPPLQKWITSNSWLLCRMKIDQQNRIILSLLFHGGIIRAGLYKKLSYRRETARQLPTWREGGARPAAPSLSAPSGYTQAYGWIRKPYVRQACRP